MKNFIFHLGLATLITHELDAMAQAEWRLLFVLRHLPDDVAASVFILLHVPLLAGLIQLTHYKSPLIQEGSRIGLSIFFMVHAGLHHHLRHHPAYTFTSPLSLSLIYGAALLGCLYVAITMVSFFLSKQTIATS